MALLKSLILVLMAGALGGFTSGMLVWALGAVGVTPTLGFHMTPDLTPAWMFRRVFASAVWGVIFLVPLYRNSPVLKGALLGLLPWLSSILLFLPYRMGAGFLGLELGLGTPIWTLFFGVIWGVTGALFLSRYQIRP